MLVEHGVFQHSMSIVSRREVRRNEGMGTCKYVPPGSISPIWGDYVRMLDIDRLKTSNRERTGCIENKLLQAALANAVFESGIAWYGSLLVSFAFVGLAVYVTYAEQCIERRKPLSGECYFERYSARLFLRVFDFWL